tara:strand:- start:80 stop:532 length:453 start_codon:yes stop_codon:yes gene_type:complete
MKNVILFFSLISMDSYAINEQHDHHMHSQSGHSETHDNHEHHSHEGHLHEMTVNGESLEVNPDRFDKFTKDLSDCKIAVVSVIGMVCDFCARGIEKTFKKDKSVLKIDVDLGQGKVVIAYEKSKEIDFDKIKNKILINGQNATKIQVLEI